MITIVITIVVRSRPSDPHEFDAVGLARLVRSSRHRLGLSTRDVAAAAGISQAYLVTIEGAVRAEARRAVPTVDVIAGLAVALGLAPSEVFEAAVRVRSRHVLLVVDGSAPSPVSVVRRVCRDRSVRWVSAVAPEERDERPEWTISLGAVAGPGYDPVRVEQALRTELVGFPDGVRDDPLGLVFERSAGVMSASGDPSVVLDFEERWADVVTDAADAAGVHVPWNVCVYDTARLASLADPVDAALRLLRSHDTVWFAGSARADSGAAATRRLLCALRPPGVTGPAWRAEVADLVTYGRF